MLFGRKKVFFTVLYRSPSSKSNSTDFHIFLENFKKLHTSLKNENPYAVYYTGDFNGHSQIWWANGDTNAEGAEIETLTSSLGLVQLITEPTNFEPHKNPSCIDLIFTDQENLVLGSGTRSTLDPLCHHQITYCKSNFQIPPPPPYKRRIWHYDRADELLIKRSMARFPLY